MADMKIATILEFQDRVNLSKQWNFCKRFSIKKNSQQGKCKIILIHLDYLKCFTFYIACSLVLKLRLKGIKVVLHKKIHLIKPQGQRYWPLRGVVNMQFELSPLFKINSNNTYKYTVFCFNKTQYVCEFLLSMHSKKWEKFILHIDDIP